MANSYIRPANSVDSVQYSQENCSGGEHCLAADQNMSTKPRFLVKLEKRIRVEKEEKGGKGGIDVYREALTELIGRVFNTDNIVMDVIIDMIVLSFFVITKTHSLTMFC